MAKTNSFTINEETQEFILKNHLDESVKWLQKVAYDYFHEASFYLETFSSEVEEEDDSFLALKVYGSLSASEFRSQNYALCEAMQENGHSKLYEIISIFQRKS